MVQHLEKYRELLIAEVATHLATFEDFPLVAEFVNRTTVDMTKQREPFVAVEVVFADGWQADLSNKPVHTITGFLILTAKTRDGGGSTQGYKILGHLYTNVQHKILGGLVRVGMSSFGGRPKPVDGWWNVSVVLPFHVNQFPS